MRKNDELIISVIMTSPRYWAAQKSAKEEFENCAMLRSAQLVERLDFSPRSNYSGRANS